VLSYRTVLADAFVRSSKWRNRARFAEACKEALTAEPEACRNIIGEVLKRAERLSEASRARQRNSGARADAKPPNAVLNTSVSLPPCAKRGPVEGQRSRLSPATPQIVSDDVRRQVQLIRKLFEVAA
jgi:hypothetical protein